MLHLLMILVTSTLAVAQCKCIEFSTKVVLTKEFTDYWTYYTTLSQGDITMQIKEASDWETFSPAVQMIPENGDYHAYKSVEFGTGDEITLASAAPANLKFRLQVQVGFPHQPNGDTDVFAGTMCFASTTSTPSVVPTDRTGSSSSPAPTAHTSSPSAATTTPAPAGLTSSPGASAATSSPTSSNSGEPPGFSSEDTTTSPPSTPPTERTGNSTAAPDSHASPSGPATTSAPSPTSSISEKSPGSSFNVGELVGSVVGALLGLGGLTYLCKQVTVNICPEQQHYHNAGS